MRAVLLQKLEQKLGPLPEAERRRIEGISSVAELAKLIAGVRAAKPAPVAARPAAGERLQSRAGAESERLVVPASFSQRRLWLLDQLDPGSVAYNMPLAVRLLGPVSVPALAAAMREIVRRQGALRTTFTAVDGEPYQVVAPAGPVELPIIDLTGLPPEPRALAVRQALRAGPTEPFDLARGPLFRPRLVVVSRGAEPEHLVLTTMHHIITDGWSLSVFWAEIVALYQAAVFGRPSPLPELPIQYTDYTAWQHERLSGRLLEEQLAYWRGKLGGAAAGLDLPMARPRPAVATAHGAASEFLLSAELSDRLRRLAVDTGTTLFMVLVAATKALIHRQTEATDLVIGSPIAGRNRPETGRLIGFFLNTLALRTDLSGDPGFGELLERVRETTLGAFTHQEVPFEQLLEELGVERDLSRTPLFQVMVNWVGFERPEDPPDLAAQGMSIESVGAGEVTVKFDLEIYASEIGPRVLLRFVYNRDLFEARQIEQMTEHLEGLLATIAEDPKRRLSALPLAPLGGRRPVEPLAENGGFPAAALEGSVFDRFLAVAGAQGGHPAVSWRGGSWSYDKLTAEALRAAFALEAGSHHRAAEPVALLFQPGGPMMAAILGALAAGRTYVPLDPSYPRERLAHMLADSGASRLLTAGGPGLDGLAAELAGGKVERLDFASLPPAPTAPADWRPSPVPARAFAYILYTSGSTGQPKGVVQNQGNVLAHARTLGLRLGIAPGDRLALVASYSFDAAVMDIFGALLFGAELCPWDVKADGVEGIAPWLAERGITLFHATPTLFRAVFQEFPEVLPELRLVVLGGEEAQPRDLDLFRRIAASTGARGARLVNGLGPTESTLALQAFFDAGDTAEALRPGLPVGLAVEETAALLYNTAGEQVALWGTGELWLQSPYLAVGYWRRPEATAVAFVPDPAGGRERVYRTGDLARLLPGGALEHAGRRDFQVKIRGVRIELGEVEAALLAHPDVRDGVVLVREDAGADREGRGERGLVAYVEPRDPEAPAEALAALASSLRGFLLDKLPAASLPGAFVVLPKLPLTPTHKVDRRALLALAPPAPRGAVAGDEPLGDWIEEAVAAIWREVLGLEAVGRRGDFFDLGGHSLSATRVVSRLAAVLGVAVPLRALFEEPVLARFAERVRRELYRGEGIELPPITPLPVAERGRLPLSFAQQRLWFLDQLAPGSAAYNMPMALRFSGALDVAVLARVVGEVVSRHESLRTTFATATGSDEPFQVIHPAGPFALPLVDLTGLNGLSGLAGAAEREAICQVGAVASRSFDLARGPLFRAVLLRLSAGEEGEHAFVSTLHHIVTDGWSTGVLVREVAALYAAFRQGLPSPLPALPVQYADFAAWQRRVLAGDVLETEVAWWRERLAGLPDGLDLPTDRPRPPVETHAGGVRPVDLPAGLAAGVQALARAAGATPFMVLLAALAELLGRYARQDDVAVGSPVAGRNRVEIEGLIGFFVNTLVLRTRLAGRPSFRELVARVRAATLGAYAHQDVPFEKLVEELQPERSLARSPLFQVLFVLQNAPRTGLELPGVTLAPFAMEGAVSAKFDLTLSLTEAGGELRGAMEYNSDLFDAATVDRWLGHLGHLLAAALQSPERPLFELGMMSAAEEAEILDAGRASRHEPLTLVHHLLARQAAATPERPAVVWEGGEQSYAELDARAEELADRLVAAGVGPDVPVGVLAERGPGLAVAFLAVLKAGGAYVPLDAAYPAERLAYMLEDAAMAFLLADEKLRGRLPETAALVIPLEGGGLPALPRPERGRPGIEPDLDNLGYVVYTSGSTGRPKGIALPHRTLANLVPWQVATSRPSVTLQFSSPSFDVSLQEMLSTWADGGTLVLVSDEARRDSARLVERLAAEGVERLYLPYVALQQLAEQLAPRPGADAALPPGLRLREIATAGERLQVTPQLVSLFERLPGAVLKNHYGPSETHVVTEAVLAGAPAAWPLLPPIGRPIPATRAYVVAPGFRLAALGMPGELLLGGAGVARGYLARPDLTAEQFVPDPFSGEPGLRLYRSGDLTRLTVAGEIEFLGRIDLQVKVRGYRIEPEEIEVALSSHPAVRECAVVVREDRPGDRRLIACYVPAEGQAAAATALAAHLAERLPEFMVPALFVPLPALPWSATGKADRQALARLPLPEAPAQTEIAAPRNPIEELLLGAFREVLGEREIGIHDSFFALGGHSLLATRVMSRILDAFGLELPVVQLFEAPTVAGLAEHVTLALRQGRSVPAAPSLVPASAALRQEPVPTSFGQERLWLFQRSQPGSTLYNIPLAVRLSGPLDPAVLTAAFRAVAARHETLRTTFAAGPDGDPVQEIAPPASAAALPLPMIDLSGLDAPAAEEEGLRLVYDEPFEPFDLERGPLCRPRLYRLSASESFFTASMFHIISDGWSVGVLVRELGTVYGAVVTGRPSPLPPLPIQYGDFARWQRAWLTEEAMADDLAYFRRRLAGLPELLDLPTDRPRPPVRTFNGTLMRARLAGEVALELRRFAVATRSTPFMLLLSGFLAVLGRYAGQDDVPVGIPIAGRTRRELEGLIGFFVNGIVLRGEFGGEASFATALKRLRQTTLETYARQELPIRRLVMELRPDPNPAFAPLFQVMFALQNQETGWEGVQRGEITPGVEVQMLPSRGTGTAKYDLTLNLADHPGGFSGGLEYNTDLFDEGTAGRFLRHIESFLAAALADPERPVAGIPLLDGAEAAQLADAGARPRSGLGYLRDLPAADGSPNRLLLPATARADARDHLEIGGCDVVELVARFGSPLYILDEATFRAACRAYREAFARAYPGEALVLYASKAWSCLAVCALAADEGLGVDAVSAGELASALRAQVPAERCYLHGNNKSQAEIDLAVEAGATLVVDNRRELETLAARVVQPRESGAPGIRILLRFAPGIECHTHEYIRTGHLDSKFGFDPDEMDAVLDLVAATPHLDFAGFHAHIGSQILDLAPHRDLAPLMAAWMARAAARGLAVRELNVGGGLGMRYTEDDDPPGIGEWVAAVAGAVLAACESTGLPLPRLLAEPGRSLIGPAGVTAYTVGGEKTVPGGRTYLSVDGGMSDNPRPITYRSQHRIVLADRLSAPLVRRAAVVGKHCETGDILIQEADLPETRPGDVLVVLGTGAYNYSMASNYNRIPRPAAVLVGEGRAEIIVLRETLEDLLRQDRLPERLGGDRLNGRVGRCPALLR